MPRSNDEPIGAARLRWRAEEIVQKQDIPRPASLSVPSREEALRLLHELRVHQIELKMQNEELRRAHAELSAIRERYFDLYNMAPVGYFIVSHDGRITETNLAGVTLLGVPRAALVKQPITRFIFKGDQDVYYLHRRRLLATGKAHTCELRMVRTNGTAFWVRLIAVAQAPGASSGCGDGRAPVTRVVLSDISAQRRASRGDARAGVRRHPAKKRPHDSRKVRAKGGRIAART
jgi:PAS domain S-box-containing protein